MKPQINYGGVVIPMVTTFTENLEIDFAAIERIVSNFIDSGTFPFILGTTGEASLISPVKKLALAQFAGKQFSGKTTIYAGISAPSLDESIACAKQYADLGIDIAVATPPNGYPLGATEQFRFFEELANAIPIPLMVYNIPQTTHISIDLQVIDKLSHHPNIVGIKDSEMNDERQEWALNKWKERPDFVYYTGSTYTCTKSLSNGGSGVVPSAGNLVPQLYQDLYLAAKAGDLEKANQLQVIANEITNIYSKGKMLYSSIPSLKGMMELAGLCRSVVMPPFDKVDQNEMSRLENSMSAEPLLKPLLLKR